MKTRVPYIKPTRRIHDSGYRIFECGYHNGDDDITVLGECSDHIWTGGSAISFNMDLTRKGYIRIWSHGPDLEWAGWIGSTAELRVKESDG